MSPETLATLLADPERASSLPRGELPEILGQLERLRAALWATLATPPANGSVAQPEAAGDQDELLNVPELAEVLHVDERWVYRRADSLPFTKRLSDRTLRFSRRGLERWLAAR